MVQPDLAQSRQQPAFYGSVVVHVCLVLRSLYQRRTLRMPLREALQVIFGLSIPFLIIGHAVNIRVSHMLYGIDVGYYSVIRRLWINNPVSGAWQSLALIVIWIHGCIGLYFWLRYRDWYPKIAGLFMTVAVMLPLLALLGFSDAGRWLEEVDRKYALPPGLSDYAIQRDEPPAAKGDGNANPVHYQHDRSAFCRRGHAGLRIARRAQLPATVDRHRNPL